MAYDSKCLYLADHFLEGREASGQASDQDYIDLAQAIQDAVEEWFRDNPRPADRRCADA